MPPTPDPNRMVAAVLDSINRRRDEIGLLIESLSREDQALKAEAAELRRLT